MADLKDPDVQVALAEVDFHLGSDAIGRRERITASKGPHGVSFRVGDDRYYLDGGGVTRVSFLFGEPIDFVRWVEGKRRPRAEHSQIAQRRRTLKGLGLL